MDGRLDRLSDLQLQLLLRAAGYSDEEIAAMNRDTMLDTLEQEDVGARPSSRLGSDQSNRRCRSAVADMGAAGSHRSPVEAPSAQRSTIFTSTLTQ